MQFLENATSNIKPILSGVLIGVYPRYLLLKYSNDNNAREACLALIIKLNNEFESFSNIHTNRTEADYYACIKRIRQILEDLKVKKSSLIISYYTLDYIVNWTLNRISEMNPSHINPLYRPVYIGTSILCEWGKTQSNKPKYVMLELIENYLSSSFFSRIIKSIRELPRRLFKWGLKLNPASPKG